MERDGYFVIRRKGLTELEVPNGGEPYGMSDQTGGQILGYLHQTGTGHNRMTGEMAGEDRVRGIEPHREGRTVLRCYAI